MPRGRVYQVETVKVHLNVPRDVHAVLMELAKELDVPASRFVTAMLVENLPTLVAMTEAARKAKGGVPDAFGGLHSTLMNTIEKGNQLALDIKGTKQ